MADVADWMRTTTDKLSVEIKHEPIEKFIKQIREMYGTYNEFPEDEERTNRILKLLKRGAKPLPLYVEANDPDLFVDKNWTKLSPVNNSNTQLSSSVSNNDYVELAFSLPIYPPSLYTANGTVTVKSGNNQLVGSGTNFSTELSVGDVIKVYSPLFPQNYFISSVLNVVSTTAINIDTTTANSSILGSGFKVDKISTPHTAFVNPQNSNISRYYNSSMAIFDSYDSMKFKIVLLASNPNLYPRVAAFRAVGVSA